MKAKKKTAITIETDEFIVLRHRERSSQTWCERCAEQVTMITANQAAIVAGVNSRTIYRWVEADRLHFIETPEGLLLVCLNSIPHSGEAIDRQIGSTKANSGRK